MHFGFLSIGLAASLFIATPAQHAAVSSTQARSAAEAETELRLARARARFDRALATHHYDRRDPEVEQLGRSLTNEWLPLLANHDGARSDVVGFLAVLASDALGTFFRDASATREPILLMHYLRAHPDHDALERFVADRRTGSAGFPLASVLGDVAMHGQAFVAPWLVEAVAQPNARTLACPGVLVLPTAVQTPIVSALVTSLPPEPTVDLSPECTVLAARSRAGRTLLAHWLHTEDTMQRWHTQRWRPIAAMMLLTTEQRSAASAALAELSTLERRTNDLPYDYVVGDAAPYLPVTSPAVRREFARMEPRFTRELVSARVRAGDPTLDAAAADGLARSGNDANAATTWMRTIGIALHDAPPLHQALVTYRERSRASAAALREVDDWLAAMSAVTNCHDRVPCLSGLIAHGPQASAARAIVALGASRLNTLDAATADALVARLLEPEPGAITTAFALTVHGCPARLRGAVEATRTGNDAVLNTRPFFTQFVAACGAAR